MSDELSNQMIVVRVVAAMPHTQVVKEIVVARGATVSDAIEQSGIVDSIQGLVIDSKMVGIFGEKVSMDKELQSGDRVEIYRPLIADPKEVRRQRAIRQAKAS